METRLSQKEKELVVVGASVAAGCIPCCASRKPYPG